MIVLIITTCLVQVSVASFAQTLTFSKKEATLGEIFKEIRSQTGYLVVFSEKKIDKNIKLNVDFKNEKIRDVLSVICEQQNLDVHLDGRNISIKPKLTRLGSLKSINENIDLSGRVEDKKGTPLAGATVRVKGEGRSTKTDMNGDFILKNIKKGGIIEISYLGYFKQDVAIDDVQYLKIIMVSNTANLGEVTVVNTGYQRMNRERSTGATVTVNSEELEKRNSVNIMQNLEGTVPGLVQYRGNATIRGVGTFQANQNILVVVDGLPIEGKVDDINPYDVESITVLKDAASAAIYGARASNGVIVITTKKAKQVGKTTLESSGNITITDKPDYSYQNFMTPEQQVDWESNYYDWYFNGGGGLGGTISDPIGTFEMEMNMGFPVTPVQYAYYQKFKGRISDSQLKNELDDYRKNNFIQDFKKLALRSNILQQYNFALRTNHGKSQHSFVANYTTDNAGLINAYERKINLHFKGTYAVAKWLNANYGINSVIGNNRSHNNINATNPFSVPSYYRLLNDDGSRTDYYTTQFNGYNGIRETVSILQPFEFNHLNELERDYSNRSDLNTRYYVNFDIKPMRGLTIGPMFQYEDNRTNISAYSEADSYSMRWLQNVYTIRTGSPGNYSYSRLLPVGGRMVSTQQRSPNYTTRMQANYERTFNKHGIIALAGVEFRQTRLFGSRNTMLGYNDQLQVQATNNVNFGSLYDRNLGTVWNPAYPLRALDFASISDFDLIREEKHRFGSGYANMTYTYDQKYNLFGSIRKDYADLFGGDEKFRGRPIWSLGSSWLISKESFMENNKFVDYLKLRISYGLTGNIRNVTARLAATTGTNRVTRLPNAVVNNPPNPQLRWEKTATTNIGTDFSLFKNRLKGTLDWYRKRGTDLFAQKRLDPSEGFATMVINNASMVNNGVEISIGYEWFRPSEGLDFHWSSNILAAWNRNKVTDIDELTRNSDQLLSGNQYRIGYPVRSIFAYQFAGLSETGVAQWYNSKGEKTISSVATEPEALRFFGSSDPLVNMAFNNDITYKKFTLSLYTVYYGGHYFRARQVPISLPFPLYSPLPSYLLNSWRPDNTNTDIPGSGQYAQPGVNTHFNNADILVRRADFIKIRNISITYNLSQNVVSKMGATNLKLRFQVNNPKSIWTKQRDVHVDPETGNAPIATSYVFGLNLNF